MMQILRAFYKGRPAHLASTGEQKALLISMILAHAKLQHQRLNLAADFVVG